MTDPAQLFLSLTLDHHAINLATEAAGPAASTLQLTATPRNARGEPMTGLPAPVFHSSDTTAVQVDSITGLITARREATGVWVVAELVAPGNVRRVDSALVNVTSTAPMLANFVLDPVPDSAVWAMTPSFTSGFLFGTVFADINDQIYLRARALDASDGEIPGLVTEYATLDSTIATVHRWDGYVADLLRPGRVSIVARTTAYGITKADTVEFTVTPPIGVDVVAFPMLGGGVGIGPGPTRDNGVAQEFRIAPHGYVLWFNLVNDTIDFTFEDTTNVAAFPTSLCDELASFPLPLAPTDFRAHCGPGNVRLSPSADCSSSMAPSGCGLVGVQIRQFPVPGVYRFSSTRAGVTGRIVVSTEGWTGTSNAADAGP